MFIGRYMLFSKRYNMFNGRHYSSLGDTSSMGSTTLLQHTIASIGKTPNDNYTSIDVNNNSHPNTIFVNDATRSTLIFLKKTAHFIIVLKI